MSLIYIITQMDTSEIIDNEVKTKVNNTALE